MDTTDAQPDNESRKNVQESASEHVSASVIGLDETEKNLIFEAEGRRFIVPVTPELRLLVRRASSNYITPVARNADAETDAGEADESPAELEKELTPREIQTRIRAGETPEDIVALSGGNIESIRRYESPIIAERNYVIEQAQAAPVTRDSEAPILGEITLDRLAARGVGVEDLEWGAYRVAGAPWTVTLLFTAGDLERNASWSFEPRSRLLTALDDEARWLTEPEEVRDEPIPTRLSPVRDWVYDVDSDGGVVAGSDTEELAGLADDDPIGAHEDSDGKEESAGRFLAQQQDLLDELSSRRGRRQPILEEDGDDPFDILGEIPAAHPPASRPEEAVDAEILQLPDAPAQQEAMSFHDVEAVEAPASRNTDTPATKPKSEPESNPDSESVDANQDEKGDKPKPKATRRSSRRASVPSWDEIVFGTRTD